MTNSNAEVNNSKDITKLKADRFFMGAKPFIVCNFPLRQLRDDRGKLLGKLTRINGNMKLDVITDPDVGLPFGRDRLILLWLKTQVSQLQTRTIPFPSAVKVLEDLGFTDTGNNLKWLREGLCRTFKATYYFGPAKGFAEDRYHIIDKIHVEWYNVNRNLKYDETKGDFVVLSE